jgi:hypothetical protein
VISRAGATRELTPPLTSHLSPLTSHLSPLASHLSPLTSHLSPLTSHLSPLTSHLSPLTLTPHLSLQPPLRTQDKRSGKLYRLGQALLLAKSHEPVALDSC